MCRKRPSDRRRRISGSAEEALTGVSFMVILAILNGFGLTASAGVGVAEKICALMFIVPGAIMAAVSAFSAQNVGAGRQDLARKAMFIGMILTVSVGINFSMMGYLNGNGRTAFVALQGILSTFLVRIPVSYFTF